MAFDDDGYLLCPGTVGAPVAASCLAHLASLPSAGPLVAAPVDDHLRSVGSLLAIPVANLLRAPVELVEATYVVQRRLPARWPEDGAPWAARLDGRDAVTSWLALDPVCLRVQPGSHRGGDRPQAEGEPVDGTLAVDLELAPADVSFHHPALRQAPGLDGRGSPGRALVLRFAAAG